MVFKTDVYAVSLAFHSEGRKREEEQDRYEEFDGRLFWTRIKTCSDISHNGTM